jgi:hypothetical protein
MILVAVAWSFYRRYIKKLVRLKSGFKAGLVLVSIGDLIVSVLMANGMEIIWNDLAYSWTTPIASVIALIFSKPMAPQFIKMIQQNGMDTVSTEILSQKQT